MSCILFFFFNDTATTEIYTLSLHDALPISLTAEGHRIVRKASGLPEEQRLYQGFVKPKELDHDADLYKVYQKAAEEVREKGGKLMRVRLDFELKESINRAKEAARHLSGAERKR